MADLTQTQLDIINRKKKQAETKQQLRDEVPTQRIRMMAQGATLGFADEIEARARALATGQTYEEALEEIRALTEAYKTARPGEAMGYEVGGAFLPAIAAAPFTGGASVPATVGRMAAVGAAEGALAGFGTGEGGFGNRMERVLPGAAIGGVAGPLAGKTMQGLSNAAIGLIDAGRRMYGQRGASIVENELQRIASETGATVDEIVQDVIDGRLLAENKTIQGIVRGYKAGGGEAATKITQRLAQRPKETQQIAMGEIESYLARTAPDGETFPSEYAKNEAIKAADRAATKADYAPFKTERVTPDVEEALKVAIRAAPGAVDEINETITANLRGTNATLFDEALFARTGEVEFTRIPTVQEAEIIRRAVGERATSKYKSGAGSTGEALAEVESDVRNILDIDLPNLADARARTAARKTNVEAFDAGQSAGFGGRAGKTMEELAKYLRDEEALQAYRSGFLSSLQDRMAATSSRSGVMRNLADEGSRENQILNMIIPSDKVGDVLAKINIARDAQEAAGKILGGSPTTETREQILRQGTGSVTATDLAGVMVGDMQAVRNAALKVADTFYKPLSDKQKSRIVDVLLSEDPEFVRKALTDEGGLQALVDRMRTAQKYLVRGSQTGAALQTGEPAGDFGGPIVGTVGRGLLDVGKDIIGVR